MQSRGGESSREVEGKGVEDKGGRIMGGEWREGEGKGTVGKRGGRTEGVAGRGWRGMERGLGWPRACSESSSDSASSFRSSAPCSSRKLSSRKYVSFLSAAIPPPFTCDEREYLDCQLRPPRKTMQLTAPKNRPPDTPVTPTRLPTYTPIHSHRTTHHSSPTNRNHLFPFAATPPPLPPSPPRPPAHPQTSSPAHPPSSPLPVFSPPTIPPPTLAPLPHPPPTPCRGC